jgi:monofunctional biosynthetic peptidoglycan transglycosylase
LLAHWNTLLRNKSGVSTRKRRIAIWQWPLGLIAVAIGCLAYSYLTLPDVRPLAQTNPASTAFIDLRIEEARAQGKPPKREQRWIAYNRISQDLKRAVLVAEDAAFWQHEGVDFDELQKSIELDWARGQLLRGASTITQQLAKNLYLSPSRNPVRKLRELIIARRLESELKKARILELYLNVIEWGDGIYGIDAASRAYFGVSASALDANRSALLAAAIVNPRLMNPARPTPRLLRRQQIILKRMGGVAPPPGPAVSPPANKPAPAEPLPAAPPPAEDDLKNELPGVESSFATPTSRSGNSSTESTRTEAQ